MNHAEPSEPISDTFLDRLVDGELSPAELRGAIQSLDSEPDGWKRCALAFLEAQAWRESFRAIPVSGATVVKVGISTEPIPAPRRSQPWRMAMAAGLAGIAFLLGWTLHPDRSSGRDGMTAPTIARSTNPTPEGGSSVGSIPSSTEVPDVSPAPSAGPDSLVAAGPEASPPPGPIPTGPSAGERWAYTPPAPITEHQQALLEQQGYQVDRRRRFVPARLKDGRRVAVPVDQVQVRYVGLETL